ncbi:OmpA family protein [Qipengyuania pacifica]|uniref:OmpA family protein n=1 Tax=Qipengyuania pacifica TaxID=2860199 RepID=UPI001C9D708D|nr:OmpA family protein [Qipengyuania pacifica]MBY8332196.1 OmpA family protein [Qipengyuania pacifica]
MNRHGHHVAIVVSTLLLAACNSEQPPTTPEEPAEGKRSIFRPEFQVEPIDSLSPPESLETRIIFPDGAELSQEARAELATVLASPQVTGGGAIVLRGHSDSGGSDDANMRASRARAEAVRDWLVENGVEASRISVIAFGEQNPAAPNALPDGSPNEEGRLANRRVEIEVYTAEQPAEVEKPTLAESLATETEDEDGEASEETQ